LPPLLTPKYELDGLYISYSVKQVHDLFSVWAAIRFWEMDNPPSEDGSNPRTMGDMIDRVKMQAVGETFEYVMRHFNLPVPDGGLLPMLKSWGVKI
jgi:hypothetical protein